MTEIFSDKKLDVTSLFLVTPSVACVKYKLKDEEIKVSRRNQLIIGAQVTAFARQILHESIRKLLHNDFAVLYTDTDSICAQQKGSQCIEEVLS